MHKSMAVGTIFSKVDNTLVPNLIELCDNVYRDVSLPYA